MGIIIFIIIVLVVLALAIYATQIAPFIPPPLKQILMFLEVILAGLFICHKAGWF